MPYPKGLSVITIWEEIAFLLNSPKDLLSLALSCRDFKELVIPDHLEYRSIRCDIHREGVWTFLASQPRLARGIRSVELISEYNGSDAFRLPQTLVNIPINSDGVYEVSDENMAMLRNSLSHMVFLKTFNWAQSYASAQRFIDIFHVLRDKTRCLEALTVNFHWLTLKQTKPGLGVERQLNNPSIWALTGLTKLAIRKPSVPAIQMINLCPDIEDLSFYNLPGESAAYMIQCVTLKKLRRLALKLSNDPLARHISAATIPFFARHCSLECLILFPSIFEGENPKLRLPYLPRLHSIGGSIFMSPPFLPDKDVISRLIHWQCLVTPGRGIDILGLPQMNNLVSYNAKFWRKIFIPASFPSFFRKAPNLERINLGLAGEQLEHENLEDLSSEKKNEVQELLIAGLLRCSRLTHAFCDFELWHGTDLTNLHESLEHFSQRLSLLRNLKFFSVLLGKERKFIGLERDQDEQYLRYQFVTLKEVGGDPDHWENLSSYL